MKMSSLLIALLLVACQTAPPASGDVAADRSVKTSLDVPYAGSGSDKLQSLDIYRPANANGPLPVHVYVHGGAWTKGDKSRLKPEQVRAYTNRGIVLVSINYRLAPAHKFPANSRDIVRASEWLESNIHRFNGDPENMVLSGHSAGAHLVALFAVESAAAPSRHSSSYYRSILSVDTATYDLTQSESEGKLTWFVKRQKRKTFGTNARVLRQASPIHQIERDGRYSELFLYATAERKNAVDNVYAFDRELTRRGHQTTVRIIPALSHSDMKDALFTPGHMIFDDVLSSFL